MAEEKKTEETPTLQEETPKKKADKVEPTEADQLVTELEKAGVSTVEELEGKLTASQQVGNMSNLLGTARQEIIDLNAVLAESKRTRTVPTQEGVVEEESDLNKIMERSVETVLDKRDKKQREINTQINQATNAMWGKIYKHPKYPIVKEVWDKKFEDPNFSMQVQQGMLNPLEEFHNTLNEYWEGIAKRSVDTIKALQGKGKIEIPHVESEGRIPQTPEELSKDQARLTELQKKAQTGTLTEEEELEAVVLKTKGLNWV